MTDIVSQKKRSVMMAGIKGKNTLPEREIRSKLHKCGFRYRLHNKSLPGKPDIVLSKYNAVVFIQGCFWHGHDCHLFKWPKSRQKFWEKKISSNKLRDAQTIDRLRQEGWRVLEVWECSLKGSQKLDPNVLTQKITSWIKGNYQHNVIQGLSKEK